MGRSVRIAGAVALALAVAAPTEAQDEVTAGMPSDMSFLLGTWHVTETIYGGTEREYVEVSVRVCSLVLQGHYVRCATEAAARGRQRSTWFMVNQPDGPGSIEFFGFLTNIAWKTLYRGHFLADGSGIDLVSYEIGEDTVTPGSEQTIRFLSEDTFEWRIGIQNRGTPDETVIGVERAVRVSPPPSAGFAPRP